MTLTYERNIMTNITISIDGNLYDFAGHKSDALELSRVLASTLFKFEKPVPIKVAEEFAIDPTDTLLAPSDWPTRLDIGGEGEFE